MKADGRADLLIMTGVYLSSASACALIFQTTHRHRGMFHSCRPMVIVGESSSWVPPPSVNVRLFLAVRRDDRFSRTWFSTSYAAWT